MTVAATQRLSRLLAMVPWLVNRQGVELAEAAQRFGISEEQLVKDLELLFVCGTPGHMPDDLIEAEWDSGQVYLGNADPIARPLRLEPDEAVALIAGLRTLADVPGLAGDAAVTSGDESRETDGSTQLSAVESALAKLTAAAQDAAPAAARLAVDLSGGAEEGVLRTAREALAARRRLHLRYVVPNRDEVTERDVDLMRVLSVDGRWYLEAWCHRAEAVRLFRVDRVASAQLLDVDGTPPPQAKSREDDAALFTASPDDLQVTLEVDPRGRWVAEYYPVESTEELADGGLRITLRVATRAFVPRLVLRLGGAGRVVSPPELVTGTAQAAREALASY
ncbi:helix-turn-helix transcriptional regulator [Spongisporangium articulatum]|uniref:Helix-turn-helix transcriptional regulator n=1 Tax=Spongisporangium articulatum TaxID=3362603 RepID=A0ABW8ART3_9ACTN